MKYEEKIEHLGGEKKWRKMMKKFFGLVEGNEDTTMGEKVVETMELNLNLSEEKVV
jgi:hypothetical protein